MNQEYTGRNGTAQVKMGTDASVDVLLGKDFMSKELAMLDEITSILRKYDYHKADTIISTAQHCVRGDIYTKMREVAGALSGQAIRRERGLGLCDTANEDIMECSVEEHLKALDVDGERGSHAVKLYQVDPIERAVAEAQEIPMDAHGNFMTDVQLIADKLNLTAPTKDGVKPVVESVDELVELIKSNKVGETKETKSHQETTKKKVAAKKTTNRKRPARRRPTNKK